MSSNMQRVFSYVDLIRSLVTTLRAAEKFEKSHLASPEVAPIIDNAKFFYVEGYFLTHGTESALEVSSKAAAAGKVHFLSVLINKNLLLKLKFKKTFVLNLSAPFLALFFKKQIDQVLEHTDIVIGNEAEAEAYAKASGHETKNIADIASKIACLPKSNPSKSRIVIFTQGADHTILVTGDKPDEPRTFPVDKLESDKIVDTNGAGDAFAGGFMGALVAGKGLDEAVLAGHALARASVQLVCAIILHICAYHSLMPIRVSGRATVPSTKDQHLVEIYTWGLTSGRFSSRS